VEVVMAKFELSPGICLDGLRKIMETSQDSLITKMQGKIMT
jgi:hypothetical protein